MQGHQPTSADAVTLLPFCTTVFDTEVLSTRAKLLESQYYIIYILV